MTRHKCKSAQGNTQHKYFARTVTVNRETENKNIGIGNKAGQKKETLVLYGLCCKKL